MKALLLVLSVLSTFPVYGQPLAPEEPPAPTTKNRPTGKSPKGAVPVDGKAATLPPGVIILNEPILLLDGEWLVGHPDGTTLALADGANCPVIIVGHLDEDPAPVRGVAIRHLRIVGSRNTQQYEGWGGDPLVPSYNNPYSYIRNNGITVRNGHGVVIEDVLARECRSGGLVLEKGCRGVIVTESVFERNFFDGVAAYETEGCLLYRVLMRDNDYAGFSGDLSFSGNAIVGCHLVANKRQGIFLRDSCCNWFDSLYIADNGDHGVFLAASEHGPAHRNLFSRISFFRNRHDFHINDESCEGNRLVSPRFIGKRLIWFTGSPGSGYTRR